MNPERRLTSFQQRSPGGVRRIAWRRHLELAMAENVGHENLRAGLAAGVAEEHHEQAVGREGRAFIVVAVGEHALAAAIGLHHADAEIAALLPGEGDGVAARRPDRRRITSLAK